MPEAFVVFLLGAVVLLPVGIMAFFAHDRLARRLHDSFPDAWRSAGGPSGYFWRPPGGLLPGSLPAFLKAGMTWPFRLPSALAGDPVSKRDQGFLRVGVLLWNAGVIGLIGFILWRYGFPPRG